MRPLIVKPSRPAFWDDPIYGHSYAMFTGSIEQLQAWHDHERLEPPGFAFKGVAACTYHYPEAQHVTLWFGDAELPAPQWHAIMAHEALHGTHRVLQHAGVKMGDDSSEAWAYYIGWLVENISRRLKFKEAE